MLKLRTLRWVAIMTGTMFAFTIGSCTSQEMLPFVLLALGL